ncbi:MAG: amidohydrolase family protein [Desulfonatronovibrio sp.]
MSADFHVHVFHPKIAGKVLEQLEDHYGIRPVGTGLVDDLLHFLDRAGIHKAVVHSAATSPDQVIPANNWAISIQETYPRLTAFGTLHPDYQDWRKELDRLEKNRIIGLKFHPDFQGYDLADSRLNPLFEEIGKRFILMFHVGDSLPPDINPSSPGKLAAIRKNHPDLIMVAAHLGGYLHWDDALKYLAGKDIYMDTSSSLPFISNDLLRQILNSHPLERLLFGSDYPLFDSSTELRLLKEKAGFSSQKIETLLENGDRLIQAVRRRKSA